MPRENGVEREMGKERMWLIDNGKIQKKGFNGFGVWEGKF